MIQILGLVSGLFYKDVRKCIRWMMVQRKSKDSCRKSTRYMVCYVHPAMLPATVTTNCDVGTEPESFPMFGKYLP